MAISASGRQFVDDAKEPRRMPVAIRGEVAPPTRQRAMIGDAAPTTSASFTQIQPRCQSTTPGGAGQQQAENQGRDHRRVHDAAQQPALHRS